MTAPDNYRDRAEATLESLRRRQLNLAAQTALFLAVGGVASLALAAAFFEATFRLSSSGRLGLLIAVIVLAGAGVLVLWRKLSSDTRLNRGLKAESYWALKLGELASTEKRDRLLNALQILRPGADERVVSSEDLAKESLYRAVSQLDAIEPTRAIDFAERKNALRIGSMLVGALLLSLLIRPTALGGAFGRLLHPGTDYSPPAPFSLVISPAGGWAYRGEPANFEILVEGPAPRTGEFVYKFDGGDEVVLPIKLESGKAAINFDGFPTQITYFARSAEVSTPPYKLEIVTRPQIVELHHKISPPAYTGLQQITGRENIGDIEALPGSKIELSLRASKDLRSATMVFSKPFGDTTQIDSLPFEVSGSHAELRFAARRAGNYSIHLLDKSNHPDRDPVQYRIHLLSDEFPAVRIPFPEEDVILGEDMVVPLRIEAEDDYGVGKLELQYRQVEGDTSVLKWSLGTTGGSRTVTRDTLWSLGEMALMPGDVLEYWAVAWDNDNISGPKRSESSRRMVRLPTFEEIIAGVEQTETEVVLDAEKALEAAKDLREEVSKLVEQMRRDPNADWERQKQIEETMKDQEQLSKQAENLSQKLDELVNKLEKHDLLTTETLEKYMELQQLMEEVASPELKEAMAKLQQAMETQDPEKIRQALEKFDMDREQFLRNIERSLSILQQLKLERKLDELAKRAEELLQAQEQALDQIADEQNSDAARSLEMQEKGVQALQNEMNDGSKLAAEAEAAEIAHQLDSLQSAMQAMKLPDQMRSTSQAAQQGQKSRAMEKGEQTAGQLAQMSASLSQLSEQFKQQKKAEISGKIRRLVEELLYVSEAQEDLMTESRELGTQSPRYRDLAGAQQDVKQGLEGIAGRMLDLSQETFFVTPELGASMGKGIQQIDRALEGFSDRMPRSAVQPQKQALGEMNRSAAQLLDILDQLSGSSSSSGYEEMMQKLSQMASAQQGLNQQTMPMPGGTQPGQMPDQMPGGEGASLSQMAAQQRALQQQMQQAAEDAKGIEEMLGDLQGIADAMGDVSKDLEDNNVGERTRRLQRQIVSRLLDATKSAREEEYSKKRESKIGQELTRRSPGPILESDRDRLRRDLMRALQEGYTPDYRRLIREYYEALEETTPEK